MAERPLLIFPEASEASRSNLGGGGGNYPRPSHSWQGRRLTRKFDQLQSAFEKKRVEVLSSPNGIDPDQVLVIETTDGIDEFWKAIKKIDGLEWMGEIEIEDFLPDEDYLEDDELVEPTKGRLYLVMTNQQALDQLLSLWRHYKNDEKMNFRSGEYRGFGKFKNAFNCLNDIRRWDIQDRLAEGNIFEIWNEELKNTDKVCFEAELWYRGRGHKQKESEGVITDLVQKLGGSIKAQCVIPSIAYHAIVGEISGETALEIIQKPEVDLLKCDNVMYFRPTGQMATNRISTEGDITDFRGDRLNFPANDPVIAVLDGMPLENHDLLSERIILDDPDNWGDDYPAIDRQHGTAIASIIVHGDLNANHTPLNRPIYIRPIMKPNSSDFRSPREENIPKDVLVVDYIHQAVKRIVEGEGDEEAVYSSVKIVNLSIGDLSRQFVQSMSPLSRLLDWLSVKYNVLFIISSGNHSNAIDTGMSSVSFEGLTQNERESLIIKKIYDDARNRKIISPAESINGLTVGACHNDDTNSFRLGHRINVFSSELPSPISAFGSGYRRSIKPDLLYSGGRVLYDLIYSSESSQLEFMERKIAPGQSVATPSVESGESGKIKYCCGSSNAAALISRTAGLYYDSLLELVNSHSSEIDFKTFSTVLIKAMLVHGCSWKDIGSQLRSVIEHSEMGRLIVERAKQRYTTASSISQDISRQYKNLLSRWIGFGVPETDKVLDCTAQRATILGFGELLDGEAHIFNLPLPPSLSASLEKRKLTVTLAWFSPIAPTTHKYREAQLWFEVGQELSTTRTDADWQAVRRSTIQHEIFESSKVVAISDGDVLPIKVNCREDARSFESPLLTGLLSL